MRTRDGWRYFLLVLVGCLALWCPARSALAQQMHHSPQGIPYVSGGVGDDERAIMGSMSGYYNLRLQFAERGGHYLGDVRVLLRGPVSLDVMSDGPLFLALLPVGTYELTAVSGGAARSRTVTIREGKAETLALFW
jgi:hypothetical protein